MSEKHTFAVNTSVSVGTDPIFHPHTMRELTDMGLTLNTAQQTIRSATNSIAEHYHSIAKALEQQARKKFGSKFESAGATGTSVYASGQDKDKAAIREALAIFRTNVGKEILYLKEKHAWDKDRLPPSCDAAVRKIINGWENNFSLEVLDTCSKLAKANSAKTKESDQALVGAALQASANSDDSEESSGESINLTCSQEHHEKLLALVKLYDQALTENSAAALTQIQSATAKLNNIINFSASKLAQAS